MKITFINSLLFLATFFYAANLFAQNKVIDSLKIQLENHKEKDTSRVYLLNDLAFHYYKSDLVKTNAYLDEAFEIADSINFKKGKAEGLYIKGIAKAIETDFKEGVKFFNQSLELYEAIDYKIGIDKCYNNLGVFYFYKGDLNQAINYYQKSVSLNEELGDKTLVAKGLYSIARTYKRSNDFSKAIPSFEKAISVYKELNDEKGVSACLADVGNIYLSQANYPVALEYYNNSLAINEALNDSVGISNRLNNIAIIYTRLNKLDEATQSYKRALAIVEDEYDQSYKANIISNLGVISRKREDYVTAQKYFEEALELYKQTKETHRIGKSFINLGLNRFHLKDYDAAYQYFEEAKKLSIEKNNQRDLSSSYLGIARTYEKLKEYDKALDYALKSKQIANENSIVLNEKEIAELLSDIYQKTGNYRDALTNYKQFKTLSDSIINKESIEKITQLEYEYKYKQQLDSLSINELRLTKTIKATSKDLEKTQRNLFLGVIGFLVTALVFAGIIFFLKLRNEKTKTQNIVIEQKLLRSQMTPHFIFNSLSVLQGMILNKEDKKSVYYLSKFSKLLRITLENSRDKLVPLQQELEAVNNYLELQNLEDNTSYVYTILVDKTIDESLFKIPPMLIQPFIENAIEHAFKNQNEKRKIDVQLKYLNRELICTITDNGIGIDASNGQKRPDKKSLATTITSERLKMLSKDFNIEGSVQIEDRKKFNEKGTVVTLVIPYKREVA